MHTSAICWRYRESYAYVGGSEGLCSVIFFCQQAVTGSSIYLSPSGAEIFQIKEYFCFFVTWSLQR
jgi:hypothetical protein